MEVSSLLPLPEGLHVEWIEPLGVNLSIGVVSLLYSSFAHSALKLHRRSTASISGRYEMSLVEGARSSFISVSASSSVVILTALEKSLPRAFLPLFSRTCR